MSEADRGLPLRRILVASDASALGLSALARASELAARLDAELMALFVEDLNLLRLAALPFAGELGRESGTRRSLELQVLERSLRADAEKAQRTLAEAAQRVPLRWSFSVTRGRLPAVALDPVHAADLVVLGLGRAVAAARVQRGAVALLFDASEAGSRALQTLWRVAGGSVGELLVLSSAPGLAAFGAAASQLPGWPEAKLRVRLLEVPPEVSQVLRVARREAAEALVLGAPLGGLTLEETLALLLESAPCPLILVR